MQEARNLPVRQLFQTSRYTLADMRERWDDPHKRESAGIDDFLVVDEDLERAVRAWLDRDLDTEVAPQHGRRPGSLNRDNSIRTAADDDAQMEIAPGLNSLSWEPIPQAPRQGSSYVCSSHQSLVLFKATARAIRIKRIGGESGFDSSPPSRFRGFGRRLSATFIEGFFFLVKDR